ncbi:hypothetical protein EZJ58_2317 [Sodalis ligni]|uniref:Uncharacterized protein n=1 Tax=Sodalis ligni TaxID=2697027 RepID=A0A4R1NHJ2_9GAMM|nr:hypothetical protein EZJ58_2317 [Sodalis ligni]
MSILAYQQSNKNIFLCEIIYITRIAGNLKPGYSRLSVNYLEVST